jgi:hypothetical protein
MAKRTTRNDERNPPPPHDDDRAPDQTASGYNPFLKAEDVSDRGPTSLTLTGWVRRTVGRYGPQVVIEVTHPDGRTFDFGIKEGSPNHRMLWRGFGRNEKDWQGSIIVEVRRFKMQNGRQSNPAVEIREVIADNPPF